MAINLPCASSRSLQSSAFNFSTNDLIAPITSSDGCGRGCTYSSTRLAAIRTLTPQLDRKSKTGSRNCPATTESSHNTTCTSPGAVFIDTSRLISPLLIASVSNSVSSRNCPCNVPTSVSPLDKFITAVAVSASATFELNCTRASDAVENRTGPIADCPANSTSYESAITSPANRLPSTSRTSCTESSSPINAIEPMIC